jgi:hypothetical protein
MGKRHLTLMMGAAVLAVSVFGAGCSRKSETSGEGAARISAINLAYSDTTSVSVTIESDASGANPATIAKPIVVPLGKKTTGNSWNTTAQGIPSGNVKYTGNAYQGTTVIFTGSILGVITAGNTANVTLNLFQATANSFANNAPVIDALQIGTTSATPGQAVPVNVVAHDPDATDTLTYLWTATCGTFSPLTGSPAVAASASETWTAPASSSAPCVLTVMVTDNHGASNTATASISVSASNKGGVALTVTPDLAPVISGINMNVTNGTPPVASPFVTGSTAHLSVQATDDGSIASYAWSVNPECTGSFSNAAISNPDFTVTAVAGWGCRFTVVVTDDIGQPTTGSITTVVVPAAGTAVAAPVVEIYSQSSDSIALNQTVYLYLAADQLAGDTLDFTWSDNLDGGAGSSATVTGGISSSGATIVTDPTVAQPNIQVKYVAPADLGIPSTPILFTVTVTDTVNHLTASHVFTITKANDPCAGNAPTTTTCDDGNACTTADHCDGAGHCVGGTATVCTASDACHVAGTCNPANGNCSTPPAPAGTSCSDGNACTTTDICNGLGTCTGGAPVVCTATTCNVPGTCDTSTGVCSAQTPAANGTTCNDGNACTTVDTCQAGACVGGSPVTCPVATDACHVAGTCVPATGACSAQTNAPNGTACNDNNLCTDGDVCTAGVCAGPTPHCASPLICSASTGACNAPACMQPTLAKDWFAQTAILASDTSANLYAAGTLVAATGTPPTAFSFNFGAGAQPEGGDFDVYVNKVDPTTGLAVWTKDFGDSSVQLGVGVAALPSVVAVIGNYFGNMNVGSMLPANAGGTSVDFVLGLSPSNGAPTWGKKIDLVNGGLSAIASNAGATAATSSFVVCGAFGVSGSNPAGSAGATDLIPGQTAFGGSDIIVAKINAVDGSVAWARQIGAAGDELCTSVAMSDDGANVYITGTYLGDALNLGGGAAAFPAATTNQARLFVAQLNGSTGATITGQTWGTVGRQAPTSITTDASGNVVLGGGFNSSLPFGGTAGTLTSSGGQDAFVAKLSSSLVPQWAHSWGGGSDTQKVNSVATDSAGNVFAVGLFGTSINLGASGAAIASAGQTDAFTVKISSAGVVGCAATYGDSAGQEADQITVARLAPAGSGQDRGMISGAFAGTLNIGPASLSTPSAAITDTFISFINENSF